MYYRYRYCDPYAGRFLQHDPLGYRDALNVYSYVRDNPVRRQDPVGLCSIEAIGTPVYTVKKGIIRYFWMSVALRLDADERARLVNHLFDTEGTGSAIMKKHARWRVKDCGAGGVPLQDASERATFVRTFGVAPNAEGDIDLETGGEAGSKAVSISTMTGGSKEAPQGVFSFVSPFYSALIAKEVNPLTECGTSGFISVVVKFEVRTQVPSMPEEARLARGVSQTISWPEYRHMPAFRGFVGSMQGQRIASASLGVRISWDCWQNVRASISSNVRYDGAGGLNTRTGREGDWISARKALRVNSDEGDGNVPIPFRVR